jgi:cell division protease FtsH
MLNSQNGGYVRDCSEATAQIIDREVKKLLEATYTEAKEVLAAHRDQLERVVEELFTLESIDGTRFYEMIRQPVPDAAELPG